MWMSFLKRNLFESEVFCSHILCGLRHAWRELRYCMQAHRWGWCKILDRLIRRTAWNPIQLLDGNLVMRAKPKLNPSMGVFATHSLSWGSQVWKIKADHSSKLSAVGRAEISVRRGLKESRIFVLGNYVAKICSIVSDENLQNHGEYDEKVQ